MIPEMIKGIIIILLTTIILYPISSIVADTMTALMGNDLISIIVITLVRYMGFFIGIFAVKWIYSAFQPPIDYRNYGVPPR